MIIEYGVAQTDQALEQILDLQRANRPENLTKEEMQKEGFITARHDLTLLQQMNTPHPHVIAKSQVNGNEKVIGYTLSLTRDFDAKLIPCLEDLNQVVDAAQYQGQPVSGRNYTIMGQVCIAKEFRGQGVFAELYQEMKRRLAPHFDYIVTSVSYQNPRSLRAHEKVGFVKIHDYCTSGGCGTEKWCIVLWDLSASSSKKDEKKEIS